MTNNQESLPSPWQVVETSQDTYHVQDGYFIAQLGVTLTVTYEPDGERALRAVADKPDKFLMPAMRVRTK